MENVLSVEYEKLRFPGNYITKEEADEAGLIIKEKDEHDDLWFQTKKLKIN